MRDRDCRGSRDDESHVFACAVCRADARAAAAWRAYRPGETPGAVDERFVRSVVRSIARDRVAGRRRRWLAAAAAAVLFSFCAGLAHERAARPTTPEPEESYASLAAPPSALTELLPN
ncbi:MAG TPA: hypothetical protein VMH79_17205 [Thermoanaerobaculia bacterium]|nr:hypothetical protein [Thermoanaerobaculia bacterium]